MRKNKLLTDEQKRINKKESAKKYWLKYKGANLVINRIAKNNSSLAYYYRNKEVCNAKSATRQKTLLYRQKRAIRYQKKVYNRDVIFIKVKT